MMNKVICVVGATAVGKTKISIEIAKHFNIDVISGDSVAIYKGLDIGSAKPTKSEMDGVIHHLIDIREVSDGYSVADFQKEARKIMDNNELSLICGGTGLYIQSALFNYEFNASSRDFSYEEKYKDYSNLDLFDLLLERDPNIDKEKLHPNNRKRVLRALEVYDELNQSIHSFNKKKEALYDYYIVYLTLDRELLYDRINKRVDKMISDGLEEEVRRLYDGGIMPHAIGYSEFIPYFEGLISLDSVIDEIKKNTRHLAKRQETWFRNQMDSHFYKVDLGNINNTIDCIIDDLNRWINR
ncbi:MAG: tRNA (adenosine(37)-N6)-dimethylallyltransferase MiaA [Acholeplasmatales bacterium]|nr:tRNA (adenosine(37)-N6)-dimethylallyltransferase MiaA [Acholeplasmatales bacterium]